MGWSSGTQRSERRVRTSHVAFWRREMNLVAHPIPELLESAQLAATPHRDSGRCAVDVRWGACVACTRAAMAFAHEHTCLFAWQRAAAAVSGLARRRRCGARTPRRRPATQTRARRRITTWAGSLSGGACHTHQRRVHIRHPPPRTSVEKLYQRRPSRAVFVPSSWSTASASASPNPCPSASEKPGSMSSRVLLV